MNVRLEDGSDSSSGGGGGGDSRSRGSSSFDSIANSGRCASSTLA
jgi:hypothetical protein